MFAQKDPNAMDVDAMSMEERSMLQMQKTRKDCPTKNRTGTTSQENQKKMTPKEMYKHIRSLTAQLNEEEKTEFFKEAKEEGF